MENKVAKKAIETIDLLKLIDTNLIKGFDVKPFLFQEQIIREKDFRANLKAFDFTVYQQHQVYIHCSVDAIVPMWAYMLLSSYFSDLSIKHIFADDLNQAVNMFVEQEIQAIDANQFKGKRVIVKGCSGKIFIKQNNYIKITEKLKPVAKSISYGEACSMVPISKN
jgi:hypothetical protein